MLIDRPSLQMPQSAELWMIGAASLSALVMIVLALSVARRERSPYPVFLLLGAAACTFHEPFVCLLGHFHYPEAGQRTAFRMLGVAIPVFHPIVALTYMGGVVFWVFTRLDRRELTLRAWWYFFVITTAIAVVFEPPFIALGLWKYFGDNQSFMILGFPVVWAIANAAALMMVGLLGYLIWHSLLGRRHAWSLAVVLPLLLFACHVPIVSPVYLALNSTHSVLVNNLAAALAGLFSLGLVYLGSRLLALAFGESVNAAASTGGSMPGGNS